MALLKLAALDVDVEGWRRRARSVALRPSSETRTTGCGRQWKDMLVREGGAVRTVGCEVGLGDALGGYEEAGEEVTHSCAVDVVQEVAVKRKCADLSEQKLSR